MLRLDVLASAAGVDTASWDRLAGDDVLASHGWLRTLEDHFLGDREARYLVVRRGGEAIAAAACAIVSDAPHGDTLDDLLLGRLRGPLSRLGLSFLPSVTVGQPWHRGAHLRFLAGLPAGDRRRAAGLLLEGIEALAAERGCAAAVVGVPRDEEPLVPLLGERGWFRAAHEPLNVLDVRWSSFEQYRRELPSANDRKSIGREMSRSRREGVTIDELSDPAPLEDRLIDIAESHYRRISGRPFTYTRGYFTALKRNLGGDARLYVARKRGEVTGVAVRLARGGVVHFMAASVDRAAAGNDFAYFRLGYYESVADAIARGDRLLCDGTGGYRTKAKRGFVTLPLDVWCFHPRPLGRLALRAWLPILSARMRRKAARETPA